MELAEVSGRFAPRLGRSVSIEQAARMLGVSRRTIYNRIREGRLLTIRTIGGSQRVLLESVERQIRRSGSWTELHASAPVVTA